MPVGNITYIWTGTEAQGITTLWTCGEDRREAECTWTLGGELSWEMST
jgi:hypothetical protein